MECSVCNELCSIPNDTNSRAGGKFAVVMDGGKIVCNHCQDVLDWADTCGISDKKTLDKPKTEVKHIRKEDKPQVPVKKTINISTISCPKCKAHFSGRVCSCGFKNPLYR